MCSSVVHSVFIFRQPCLQVGPPCSSNSEAKSVIVQSEQQGGLAAAAVAVCPEVKVEQEANQHSNHGYPEFEGGHDVQIAEEAVEDEGRGAEPELEAMDMGDAAVPRPPAIACITDSSSLRGNLLQSQPLSFSRRSGGNACAPPPVSRLNPHPPRASRAVIVHPPPLLVSRTGSGSGTIPDVSTNQKKTLPSRFGSSDQGLQDYIRKRDEKKAAEARAAREEAAANAAKVAAPRPLPKPAPKPMVRYS